MEDITVWIKVAKCFAAAFTIGIGTIGPALSQGRVGATACENIGKYKESESSIRGLVILALGMIETSSVFALVIAVMLILFVN